jgi:hypothetical protein
LGMYMQGHEYKVVTHVCPPQWLYVYGLAIVMKRKVKKNRTLCGT